MIRIKPYQVLIVYQLNKTKIMINTEKLFLIVGTILFVFSIANAQEEGSKRGHGKRGKAMSELALTDIQKEEAKQIRSLSKQKIEAIKMDPSIENKREAVKEVREASRKDFEQILNKQQLVTYKAQEVNRQIDREKRKEERKAFKEENKVALDAMKIEMEAYKKEVINPVVLEQRIAFDSKLSGKDKKIIDNIKKDMKSFKNSRNSEGRKDTEAYPERRKKGGNKMHAYFQANPQQKAQLLELVERNRLELEKVQNDLSTKQASWDKEMQLIKSKHLGDKMKGERSGSKKFEGKKGHRGMRDHNGKGHGKEAKAIKFLMMKTTEKQTK